MMEGKHLVISSLHLRKLQPVLGGVVGNEDVVLRIILCRGMADVVSRYRTASLRLTVILGPEGPEHHHITQLQTQLGE